MASTFSVGDFSVYVGEPYPVSITISCGNGEIRLSHGQLSDLEYAVRKAMRNAELKLNSVGQIASEVRV